MQIKRRERGVRLKRPSKRHTRHVAQATVELQRSQSAVRPQGITEGRARSVTDPAVEEELSQNGVPFQGLAKDQTELCNRRIQQKMKVAAEILVREKTWYM